MSAAPKTTSDAAYSAGRNALPAPPRRARTRSTRNKMIDLTHIRLPLCQSVLDYSLIQEAAIGPRIRANNPPICEDWIGLPVLYYFLLSLFCCVMCGS